MTYCSFYVSQLCGGAASQVDLFIGCLFGGIIVIAGVFAIRVYYEYPWGRFFWKKKGIKAVVGFSGAPGMIGTLTPYLDKVFLFVSSGRRKNKIVRLIPAVPGAAVHLRQEDGGDSFVLIDGDVGMPVSRELEGWAETNLGELADSHDWNHFALKTKYAMCVDAMRQVALFPIVDWSKVPMLAVARPAPEKKKETPT